MRQLHEMRESTENLPTYQPNLSPTSETPAEDFDLIPSLDEPKEVKFKLILKKFSSLNNLYC